MMKTNLIGIGEIASEIAKKIYNEDDCYLNIWPENIVSDKLEGFNSLEENEKIFEAPYFEIDMDIVQETWCFIDGAQGVSGIVLKLLELFKSKPIVVFYIKTNIFDYYTQNNHKITFNVLQEYSRSGMFKTMFVFDYMKMIDSVIENLPDNVQMGYGDIHNLVIDRIIFGANIYWRLTNEKYAEGNKISWDLPNYKIMTFLENNFMYYDLKFSGLRINVTNVKSKMDKSKFVYINNLKNKSKQEQSDLILLFDDVNDFMMSIIGTGIPQEADERFYV